MIANYTPGPWHWQGDSLTHRQFNIYAPNNSPHQHVCTVNNLSVDKLWQRDATQAEANARLIAAAPDLLSALQQLAQGWAPLSDPTIIRGLAEARAAIAKATGG